MLNVRHTPNKQFYESSKMSKLIKIENPLNLLALNSVPVASSLDVAREFGKQHKDVLEKIDKLISDLKEINSAENSAQYKTLNIVFEISKYKDESGKSNRMYYLSEDAFNLLIMGFTGKKAMLKKLEFASCFSIVKNWIKDRESCKLEYKQLNGLLKDTRSEFGKETLEHVYTNEANLINKLALGCTAKEYCELHNIPRESLRNYLSPQQLELINKLQQYDEILITSGELDYGTRKEKLTAYKVRLLSKLLNQGL